jgi:hypothetical protein
MAEDPSRGMYEHAESYAVLAQNASAEAVVVPKTEKLTHGERLAVCGD